MNKFCKVDVISELPSSGEKDSTGSDYESDVHVLMNTASVLSDECKGFVIVVDNVDKNFRPSHQREDRQTKSLHITHSYAVKNRVDISMLSDEPPSAVLSPELFLLTKDDVAKILRELEVFATRFVIVQCMQLSI